MRSSSGSERGPLVASIAAAILCITGCSSPDFVSGEEQPAHHHHHEAGSGEVVLTPEARRALGVRTAAAERGILTELIRAPAVVQADERRIAAFYAPTDGFVQKLSVLAVGEPVRNGQMLFELYSPELVTLDEQYLQSLAGGSHRWDNPFARGIRTLGIGDDMIAAIADKKRPVGRLPFYATSPGVVTEVSVREGARVVEGTSVVRIAPLDPLWVIATVPASHATLVKVGTAATVLPEATPGERIHGRVDYIYPELDPVTRAARVRVVVRNPSGTLKLNTLASVEIESASAEELVHIPVEAAIRGGRQDRVVVALGDDRFASREVTLGREYGHRIAVLEGLEAGDKVVTAGLFLIDSEANLKSSLGRLDASDVHHDHGMHGGH